MKKVLVTRSPLKAAPLRHAGQSVQEEMFRVLEDGYLPYLLLAGMLAMAALSEWIHWYFQAPPFPKTLTAVAALSVVLAVCRFRTVMRKIRLLKQGRDGERAVGEYLERLRVQGYVVMHDLIGDRFNVDHVLIGPAGVFTVETKTISKPTSGKAEVDFDGQQISVGGFRPDRDPVVQGRAQAGWLRELIVSSTGKRFPVKALVVYPGWYVNAAVRPFSTDVTVLNPKGLPALLGALPRALTEEDAKLITYHLSRMVRTAGKGHIVQQNL